MLWAEHKGLPIFCLLLRICRQALCTAFSSKKDVAIMRISMINKLAEFCPEKYLKQSAYHCALLHGVIWHFSQLISGYEVHENQRKCSSNSWQDIRPRKAFWQDWFGVGDSIDNAPPSCPKKGTCKSNLLWRTRRVHVWSLSLSFVRQEEFCKHDTCHDPHHHLEGHRCPNLVCRFIWYATR